jgi:hypothetical protein
LSVLGAFEDGFEAFVEVTAGEEDAALAALADEADVCAEADDDPVGAAAGVFFA